MTIGSPEASTAEPAHFAGREDAGTASGPAVGGLGTPGDWLRLLRPRQWLKNAFVLAPLLFSGRLVEISAVALELAAFVAFCLLASAVYISNDVIDRAADRAHPVKRNRPLAAGRIPTAAALTVSALLLGLGLGLAAIIGTGVALFGATYVGLNLLYSYKFKHVVILDVFFLAAFFLLRLLAGAAAIAVEPSVWLLLCGGLLALYLGFAKRRHELVLLGDDSHTHRSVLSHYTAPFLDQMSVVLLAVTVVAYIMYTLNSQTAALVGSERLTYSTVFVLYGVFRYLYLVHNGNGGNPAETLVTDRALLVDVALWLLYCGWAVYRPF